MENEQNENVEYVEVTEEVQISETIDISEESSSWLSRIPYYVLTLLAFLLPIFAIPWSAVTLESSKMWILGFGVLALSIFGLVRMLLGGSLRVPRNTLSIGMASLAVVIFFAGIFSPASSVSFLGSGIPVGTVSSLSLMVLLFFMAAGVYQDQKNIFMLFAAIFVSYGVLAFTHLIRHIGGVDVFSFGILTGEASSLIGRWNDFAVFSGLILILSTLGWHYLKPNALLRGISAVLGLAALFFLILIDFWILWLVVGFFLLLFALHTGWRKNEDGTRVFRTSHFSTLALVLFVIAVTFGFFLRFPSSNPTVLKITQFLGAPQYSEVVLPPGATLEIGFQAISENPFFGVSPNRFSSAFHADKPEGINHTVFWDTIFEGGFSHLLTFISTQGILGVLVWILILVGLVIAVFRALAVQIHDRVLEFLLLASALGSLYLWSINLIFLPGIAMFALTFFLTGALVALLTFGGIFPQWEFRLPNRRGWGVALVPITVLSIIGFLFWGYGLFSRLEADRHFQEARTLLNQGDLRSAQTAIQKAIRLSEQDTHYRFLTDVKLLELQQVLAEVPASEEELRRKVVELSNEAGRNAEMAVKKDPTNPANYISQATAPILLASIGIQEMAPIAVQFLSKAAELSPESPKIYFSLAQMEALAGNIENARIHLHKALELRPNYSEAIAALMELEGSSQGSPEVLQAVERGLSIEPNNFVIAYQLGFLYFQRGEYAKAIPAFEQAVIVNPSFANALYFLGVSYARSGDVERARAAFDAVRSLNPDHPEILRVIENLNAGRDPLSNVKAPVFDIEEKSTEETEEGE